MFLSKPEHYRANIRQVRSIKADPATLTTYNGERQPAVVLYLKGSIYGVLPVTNALRLANELADAITAHNGQEDQ